MILESFCLYCLTCCCILTLTYQLQSLQDINFELNAAMISLLNIYILTFYIVSATFQKIDSDVGTQLSFTYLKLLFQIETRN